MPLNIEALERMIAHNLERKRKTEKVMRSIARLQTDIFDTSLSYAKENLKLVCVRLDAENRHYQELIEEMRKTP